MVKRGGFYRFRPGERVVCPRCGREGVAVVHRVRVGGRVYEYLAVRHGKKTVHSLGPVGKNGGKTGVGKGVVKNGGKAVLPAGPEGELARLREENEQLRRNLEALRGEVRRLLRERAELRNRLHFRSPARARAEVPGGEAEYDPLSLAPYDLGGWLLCPLCGLEFQAASLGDYLSHLRWHRLSSRALAAVEKALRELYGE